MIKVTFTWGLLTPRAERGPTIHEALVEKLGREPTRAEIKEEFTRIWERAVADQCRVCRNV